VENKGQNTKNNKNLLGEIEREALKDRQIGSAMVLGG
jgi:hypothetical protein